jgi:hypothetical protein
MRVKALRGVCIGVNRNLNPGDTADLDPATVQFLTSIGAVAPIAEEEQSPQETPAEEPASSQPQAPESAEPPAIPKVSKAGKAGSKEK